ncbi:MAG: response regulator [Acidobacteria bacterium]|nr:response regulator [Acidobacteriota bacterium]
MQEVKAKIGRLENIDNEAILQSLSEGVCVIDAGRKIAFANRSAARQLGCDAAGLLGRNYDLVLFGRDKRLSEDELAVCPIQFALTEGAASHINEESFLRADGGVLAVEYLCSPVFENGAITGAVVTFQDIGERRDIERAVAAARDAAHETARTKAAFLANMSHEIRTPLSGIVGTANLLMETELTGEQRKYLQMLQKSVDLLMETVNDILDFSKIEAGKLTLETIDFDLRALLAETVELFAVSAGKKKLGLRCAIDERIPAGFRGDANRLRQILNNLLSNAIKFTETGEIRLDVALTGGDDARPTIRFEVTDTGIGIGEAQKARLFQPFTQADISTTRLFGGTGLGLTICREIVEMMKGEIGFESEPGRGSRFWFAVPLAASREVGFPADELPAADADRRAKTAARELRILVAEDDDVNREITGKLLEHLGCACEFARHGAEAVSKCAETDFDLILMDCQMPELDGLAATAAIRRQARPHRPTIVALTAFSAVAEREKCLHYGMDDYLCKPVTKDALTKILRKHFSTEKSGVNLDLEADFVQHSLADVIAPETLRTFLAIEARGEPDFVSEILQIYCENAEKQILLLADDLRARDADAIRRRAHHLKGSSANVGVTRLTGLFEDLQIAANLGNWERIESLISETTENFEFTKRRIFERENL